jgi:hypothetical protein
MALALLPILPLLAALSRRRILTSTLALAIAATCCFWLALRTPTFTRDSPQHLTITFLEQEGQAHAQLAFSSWESSVPSSLLENRPRLDAPNPLYGVPGIITEAPSAGLPAPSVSLLSSNNEGDLHRVRVRLKPSLPSRQVLAGVPVTHELDRVVALDKTLSHPPGDANERKWLRFRGLPEEGIDVELSWRGPATLPLTLVGITSGLPDHLDALAARRAALPAVPSHMGDETILVREVLLEAPER